MAAAVSASTSTSSACNRSVSQCRYFFSIVVDQISPSPFARFRINWSLVTAMPNSAAFRKYIPKALAWRC